MIKALSSVVLLKISIGYCLTLPLPEIPIPVETNKRWNKILKRKFLTFFLKMALEILWFHMIYRIIYSSCMKNVTYFVKDCIKFVDYFGRRKWQPTPVFLPGESHGHGIAKRQTRLHFHFHFWVVWLI